MAKKWTEAKDKAADRKAGIKEGSPRDVKLDRSRGLPPDVVKKGTVGAGHAANKLSPMGAGADKNWISGAIKKPGALHRDLGVPAGKKIPTKKLNAAANSSNPTTARRANLAKTLKGFNK